MYSNTNINEKLSELNIPLCYFLSYQSDGHKNQKQRQVMEHQHPVLPQKSPHCFQRVVEVQTFVTSDPLSVVVAQIHGIDVAGHVRSAEQGKPIHEPVTVN